MSGYALGQAGAEEFERARLALLAQVSDPFTLAQLDAIGVQPGWRCVDVGAGGGAVTRLLAARVGAAGSVLALDLDTRLVEPLADDRISVVRFDLLADTLGQTFDLAHARHLLMHLPRRAEALRRLAALVRPGGWVAVGDVDFVGLTVWPVTPAWQRTWSSFRDALILTGWDIGYGARLAADMRAIGLVDVESHAYTHDLPGNSAWARLFAMTLERLRGPMRAVGASDTDINAAISLLTDPATIYRSPTACYALGRVH